MGINWKFRELLGWGTFISLLTIGTAISNLKAAVQTDNDNVGTVSSSFLQVNPGVRTAALGRNQAAAYGNLGDMFSNPASLTSLSIPNLWITHNNSFIDTKYNTLGFGLPLENNAFGFSAQYIDEGSFERINIDPSTGEPVTGLGNFRFSTMLLQAAWARDFTSKFSLGLSLKGWHESREFSSSNGWATDGGLLIRSLLPSLDLGLAFRNLGPSVDGNSLPDSYAIGTAYHIPFKTNLLNQMSLFSEADFADHRDTTYRGGLEFRNNHLWLRGGYESLSSDVEDTLGHFGFGAGFRIDGWKLDYAWIPKGELGDQHRVALTVGFGLSPEDRARVARELDLAMEKRMKERADKMFAEGQKEVKRGHWEKAQHHFSQSLLWNPNHKEAKKSLQLTHEKLAFKEAQTHYQKGLKLIKQKQWLDAAYQFQQTLKIVPTHKKANTSLKKAERNIKRPKAQTAKSSIKAGYNRGVRYYLNGKYESALQEWKQVLKKSPKEPNVREYIEKAEKMILAKKLKSLQEKQRSTEDEMEALSQQAYTLYLLGQPEKAIRMWKKIILTDPDNKDAKRALKEAQEKQKLVENDPSLKESNKIYELNAKALSAYNDGKLETATAIWRQILELDPHNIWIKNNLKRVENELAGR